jgi:hypothetical protein
VQDGHANASPLKHVLADPGACRYDRPAIQRVPAATWIARSPPRTDAEWDVTIDEAIDAQRALGVDLVIMPTVTLHQATGQTACSPRSMLPGERMPVGSLATRSSSFGSA